MKWVFASVWLGPGPAWRPDLPTYCKGERLTFTYRASDRGSASVWRPRRLWRRSWHKHPVFLYASMHTAPHQAHFFVSSNFTNTARCTNSHIRSSHYAWHAGLGSLLWANIPPGVHFLIPPTSTLSKSATARLRQPTRSFTSRVSFIFNYVHKYKKPLYFFIISDFTGF